MLYVIQVCWQLVSRSKCSCSQAISKPVWHITFLCLQWKTPDDGQRNCPKHVEFHSNNKFEKILHLVGFIIRNLSRGTVTWTSNTLNKLTMSDALISMCLNNMMLRQWYLNTDCLILTFFYLLNTCLWIYFCSNMLGKRARFSFQLMTYNKIWQCCRTDVIWK